MCDFCLEKDVLTQPVRLLGTELHICSRCIGRGKFSLVSICPRCKKVEWVATDILQDGLSAILIECMRC